MTGIRSRHADMLKPATRLGVPHDAGQAGSQPGIVAVAASQFNPQACEFEKLYVRRDARD